MKAKLTFLVVPTLAVALQLVPSLLAQQPPPERPFRPFQNERRARLANLSEEERARLKAAHQKALEDPAVRAAQERLRQARREFRQVMRPALIKADPSIQAILDKLRPEKPGRD
jgi:Spy/CpxP family protein refolding chaperone